jgi:hypothetical protein
VADDLLAQLDKSIAASAGASLRRRPAATDAEEQAPAPETHQKSFGERWPWATWFLAAQFLWGALLFLPGSQAYRPVVRALPYAFSVALLVVFMPVIRRGRAPRGAILIVLALGLLVLNLLRPTSQLQAGLAQCVFQLTIAAPMFWGWKAVATPARLRRLLWIALWFNTVGSVLGVLQVYYPDRFLPPQFNTLGVRLNELYVESLTYIGPDGTPIVRPPGLSDQPGGAAISGALTVVLGAALGLGARTTGVGALTVAAVAVGLAALYLTQVRSLFLMSIGALAVLAVVLFRRGQVKVAGRIAVTVAILVVGSFFWARSLGGKSVEQRFVNIAKKGAVESYQETRGGFVDQTFGELLDQYPLGAGVGRWGMMQIYFGEPNLEAPPIYVEIQLTGWLLDGGLPMWLLYGGALALAVLTTYRRCLQRFSPELADVALIVLGVQVLIAGLTWAGPAFNTQLGILFWFVTSALHGATRGAASGAPDELVASR